MSDGFSICRESNLNICCARLSTRLQYSQEQTSRFSPVTVSLTTVKQIPQRETVSFSLEHHVLGQQKIRYKTLHNWIIIFQNSGSCSYTEMYRKRAHHRSKSQPQSSRGRNPPRELNPHFEQHADSGPQGNKVFLQPQGSAQLTHALF